jgi:ParB-like chromosome segregation protein Spo0J
MTNKPAPKPWREVLRVHPEADLYPLLAETDPAALRELAEDIQKNGLQVPIVILRTGPRAHRIDRIDRTNYALADGRNRLDAMNLIGIDFKLVWKKGAYDWNWILVTNIVQPDKGAVCCTMITPLRWSRA